MIFIDVVSNDNKPVEVFGDCQSNNSTRVASSSEYDTKNTPGSLLASVVRSGATGSFVIMKANLALSALIAGIFLANSTHSLLGRLSVMALSIVPDVKRQRWERSSCCSSPDESLLL